MKKEEETENNNKKRNERDKKKSNKHKGAYAVLRCFIQFQGNLNETWRLTKCLLTFSWNVVVAANARLNSVVPDD